MSLKLSER